MTRVMARVYPTGEGSLWIERPTPVGFLDPDKERKAVNGCLLSDRPEEHGGPVVVCDPELAYPLGLSKVPNSQDELKDTDYQAVQRGVNGITVHGARMVRSAAYLMQAKWGRRQLTFLTTTIPGSPELTCAVAAAWPEITRRFLQALKEKLVRTGLPPIIISVTEVQEKRFRATGGMPLHLHMVFRGRFSDEGPWCLTKSWVKACWETCVTGCCPDAEGQNFTASTRIEAVRDSAAGYLGKYMSKGASTVRAIAEEAPELLEFLPRQWWNATQETRKLVDSNTRYGEAIGEAIEAALTHPSREFIFEYLKEIPILNEEGRVVSRFWVYKLRRTAFRQFGIPQTPWDIIGLDM